MNTFYHREHFVSKRYLLVKPRSNGASRKITGFSDLPIGWHYGKGAPIDSVVISRAKEINRIFLQMGFNNTDAFPGISGEVQVTAYEEERTTYKKHYIGIIIEPTLTMSLTHEIDGEETSDDVDDGSYSVVLRTIRKIARRLWTISGSYTLNTMTKREVISPNLHSKTTRRISASR